jgi:hypothetical protein
MKSNNHETHTIVVFDKVIEEQARHRNSTARKVWIIVHPFTYFDTSRRVNITSKEREQVVLPGVNQLKHRSAGTRKKKKRRKKPPHE